MNVGSVGSSWELLEQLAEELVHPVICLHAPPMSEDIEAVKGVRRLNAIALVTLASWVQNTVLSLQAIQSQVTWSIGLASDKSVEEALSDLVVDASKWSEKQATQRTPAQ